MWLLNITQPEVPAALNEAIHQSLELHLYMGCDCSIIHKQHLSDQSFPYFCFELDACEIKQPAVQSGVKVDPLCCCVKGMFQEQGKEDPKECWHKDTALFDATAYVKWFQCASILLYCPLHDDVEISNEALQFWLASYLRQVLE